MRQTGLPGVGARAPAGGRRALGRKAALTLGILATTLALLALSLRPWVTAEMLWWAATHQCPELASLSLRLGAPPDPEAPFSPTPLQAAAAQGDLRGTEVLLAAGASVNARNREGATALMLAAAGGHEAVIRELLARGADPLLRGRWGATAADTAAMCGHTAAARPLLRAVARPPLQTLAAMGDAASVEESLAAGARIEETNGLGLTALGAAAALDRAGLVRVLLAHGADPNRCNRAGVPPLTLALAGSGEALLPLLKAGARVDARDLAWGATPLHYAYAWRRSEAIRVLLAHGADPGARDYLGLTPADWGVLLSWHQRPEP